VFAAKSTTPKDISTAGEQVLVNMYNGTVEESLDSLCYKCFCEKVATNAVCIHIQTLPPPTSAAAKYHIASMYTYKYRSGKVAVLKCSHWNGDGKRVMEN